MITVLIVAAFSLNFGPMYKEEQRARETGKLLGDGVQPLVPEVKNELPQGYKLTMWNFIIPILFLFGSLFATIFWSGDLVNNGWWEPSATPILRWPSASPSWAARWAPVLWV